MGSLSSECILLGDDGTALMGSRWSRKKAKKVLKARAAPEEDEEDELIDPETGRFPPPVRAPGLRG